MESKKKYAALSPDFVRLTAEAQFNNELEPEAAKALAEDTSYRIRDLVHTSRLWMIHSRRKRLSVQDVNKALRWGYAQTAYGRADAGTPSFEAIKGSNLFVERDGIVDLCSLALSDCRVKLPSASVVRIKLEK